MEQLFIVHFWDSFLLMSSIKSTLADKPLSSKFTGDTQWISSCSSFTVRNENSGTHMLYLWVGQPPHIIDHYSPQVFQCNNTLLIHEKCMLSTYSHSVSKSHSVFQYLLFCLTSRLSSFCVTSHSRCGRDTFSFSSKCSAIIFQRHLCWTFIIEAHCPGSGQAECFEMEGQTCLSLSFRQTPVLSIIA